MLRFLEDVNMSGAISAVAITGEAISGALLLLVASATIHAVDQIIRKSISHSSNPHAEKSTKEHIRQNIHFINQELGRTNQALKALNKNMHSDDLRLRFEEQQKSIKAYHDRLSEIEKQDHIQPQEIIKVYEEYSAKLIEIDQMQDEILQENFEIEQEIVTLEQNISLARSRIDHGLNILAQTESFLNSLIVENQLSPVEFKAYALLEQEYKSISTDENLSQNLQALNNIENQISKEQDNYKILESRLLNKAQLLASQNILSKAKLIEKQNALIAQEEQQRLALEKLKKEQEFEEQLNLNKNRALKVLEECKLYVSERSWLEKIQKHIVDLKAIEQIEYAHNYYQTIALPLLKKCKEEKKKQDQYRVDFELLFPQYKLLSEVCGEDVLELQVGESGLEKLKEEIARLEKRFEALAHSDLISKIIDETMVELGYELIAEQSKNNRLGQRVDQKLVQFTDHSAIHFTFTENGQMALEIVGIDKQDRLPSMQEAKALKNDMVKFCDRFPKIKGALKKHGLNLDRINILPADEQFAKILNIANFELKEKDQNKAQVEQSSKKLLYQTLDEE